MGDSKVTSVMEVEERAAGSDFGTLLRRYRLAAGLSQEALAERARMSSDGISALERGHRRTPQRETLALLAGALALSEEQRREFETAAVRAPIVRRGGPVTVGPWPDVVAADLPLSLTSFVGRENELAEIATLAHDHRLVTLTGSGGVGKTQTALRAASALGDEVTVRFVGFAPVSDPSLVVATIASALGVQEVSDRPLLETVTAFLRNRTILLVLDNCEHLVSEVANVAAKLLLGCPGLRLLATSREPMKAAGEYAYRLPSLDIPSAVVLFADRAQAVDHRFALTNENAPLVTEICRRLDRIPLAIELAAARINLLPVQGIANQLDHRFYLLSRGERTVLPRQQTMRATIEWSYDLLAAKEQRVFERLSVFAGGCTLDSAVAVCADEEIVAKEILDVLSSLVDKSLVVTDFAQTDVRYRLLESFQEFGAEQLARRGDLNTVEDRHARSCLGLAERAMRAWESEPDAVWHAILRAETDNWRGALRWTLADGHDILLGQRIAGELGPLFPTLLRDGRRWLPVALESVDARTPIDVLAKLRIAQAMLAKIDGAFELALACSEDAIALFERHGNVFLKQVAQIEKAGRIADLGRMAEGRQLMLEILAARPSNSRLAAFLLESVGFTSASEGDLPAARSYVDEALQRYRALGLEWYAARCMGVRGLIEMSAGDPAAALGYATDAVTAIRNLDVFRSDAIAFALTNVSAFLVCLRRYDEAAQTADEALAIAHDFKLSFLLGRALRHLAVADTLRSDQPERLAWAREKAARIIGFVEGRLTPEGTTFSWFDSPEGGEYARAQAVLRDELGSDVVARLMAEGAALTEDEVVEEALSP